MIQNDTTKNNIFGLFPTYNLEQSFVVRKEEPKAVSEIKNDTVDIKKKGLNKKSKQIIFGSTLASTIVGAGLAGLLFIKGGNKGSSSKLREFTEKLTKEIQEASVEKTSGLFTKFKIVTKKGTKKTIDILQASSNANAIKDGAVDRVLRSNGITRPFAEGSKKMFQKVVDKTLRKKYTKVGLYVDDLTTALKHYKISDLRALDESQKLQKVTIKGVTKTLGEWVDDLARHVKDLSTHFDDGFSCDALVGRQKKRSGLLSGLAKRVTDRFFKGKGILKPENYKTYATEELSKAAQDELRVNILNARKKVTNNIPSIHEGIRTNLSLFSQNVRADDNFAIKTIKTLKQKLDIFRSCSGVNEASLRSEISDDIVLVVDDAISGIIQNVKYSNKQKETLVEQLLSIKDAVLSTKKGSKGALEEIRSILKGLNEAKIGAQGKRLVSNAELKHFSKLSSKISDGLNKATELEMGEYFLKQAELEVGSAANDVLSVVLPIGVGAYSIAKGDNKEERTSAVLTTCIPLVGTFATFVYGTAKMFSGAKNLIFSAVSGIALSKLGNYCDKLYKNYKNSGSVVKVAKDEYDKFWTDLTPNSSEKLKLKTEQTKKEENKEVKK